MADITQSLLTQGTDSDNLTAYATASHTPTADALVLLLVVGNDLSEDEPSNPTSVTGNGLTWVEVISKDYNSNATPRNNLTVFRAMGSSPSEGATTINYDATQNHCKWIITEFENVRTSGANGADAIVQAVSNSVDSATSITATLATFEHANNATFGAFGNHTTAPTWTQGTGFTLIAQTAGDLNALAQFRTDNDTSVDASHDGSSSDIVGIGIEIRNAIGAIAETLLASDTDEVDRTSYTTASITPSGDTLILLAVRSAHTGGGFSSVPAVSGNGLTWVQIATQGFNTTQRVSVFRAMGSSPSSGVVTINYTAEEQARCMWAITEFSGIDIGGSDGANAVVQAVSGTAFTTQTSETVTLAAFADSANATYGTVAHNQQIDDTAPGSGFTELTDVNSNGRMQTQWRVDNDTTVDWTFSSATGAALAVEIRNLSAPVATTAAAGTAGHLGIMF